MIAKMLQAIRDKFSSPEPVKPVPEEVAWMQMRIDEQQRRLESLQVELRIVRREVEEAQVDDRWNDSGF